MLHVEEQSRYVGVGVLQDLVGVVSVCMLAGGYEGRTGESPSCFKTEPLELDDAGKVRKDGIRRRESQQQKKSSSCRETCSK